MNILMINTIDSVGGAAGVAMRLALGFRRRGHSVRFLVGYKNLNYKNVSQVGLDFMGKIVPKKYLYALRYLRSFLFSNDIVWGAGEEIISHNWVKWADIIHLHNIHGNFLKMEVLPKLTVLKPTLWTLHDIWALTSHCANCFGCKSWNRGRHFTPSWGRTQSILWDNSSYLWNKKRKIISSCKVTFVTPSKWLFDLVKSEFGGDVSLLRIPNGIDVDFFYPHDKLASRKKLGLPIQSPIVLFISNGGLNNPVKGSSFFVEMARRRKEILFVCVGGNKYKIDGNLHILPDIVRSDMPLFYSASDVLLMPSLSENFPLSSLEAMACGIPVVSFGVGGLGEQVKHLVNGYNAKYGNIDDLICGVDYFISLDSKRLSSRIRNRVTNFYSESRMVDLYLKAYNSLV